MHIMLSSNSDKIGEMLSHLHFDINNMCIVYIVKLFINYEYVV